jgi:hypothetical protein
MKLARRWFAMLAAVGLVSLMVVLHALADTGQVIDSSTGKPLAGVYVVARWDGLASAGITGRHRCFGISGTKTDAHGEYSLSSLSWNINPFLSDRQRTQFFYKEGYRVDGNTAETQGNRILMSPDPRTGNARIGYIGEIRALKGCGSESAQRKELTEVFRATLEETRRLATTKVELRGLNNAIYDLETLEMDFKKALDRYEQRSIEWGI